MFTEETKHELVNALLRPATRGQSSHKLHAFQKNTQPKKERLHISSAFILKGEVLMQYQYRVGQVQMHVKWFVCFLSLLVIFQLRWHIWVTHLAHEGINLLFGTSSSSSSSSSEPLYGDISYDRSLFALENMLSLSIALSRLLNP